MKVRAIWLRHTGNWGFYRQHDEIRNTVQWAGDHQIEVPDELWERYEAAHKEHLAVSHEIARLIPSNERYATIRAKQFSPQPVTHATPERQ